MQGLYAFEAARTKRIRSNSLRRICFGGIRIKEIKERHASARRNGVSSAMF